MERCWCDEERAPYSTSAEKVRRMTEARSAVKIPPVSSFVKQEKRGFTKCKKLVR